MSLGLTIAFCCIGLYAADFSVNRYGARGDGAAVETRAIQAAIDAASKAGGGTVVVKPGVYRSGALFLKTGVHLRVDEGVEIRGVPDIGAYPITDARRRIEMSWPAALINVHEQSKVTISGKGVIDGEGKVWWDPYWKMRREDYEPRGLRWAVGLRLPPAAVDPDV